jgi:hypothetical protein
MSFFLKNRYGSRLFSKARYVKLKIHANLYCFKVLSKNIQKYLNFALNKKENEIRVNHAPATCAKANSFFAQTYLKVVFGNLLNNSKISHYLKQCISQLSKLGQFIANSRNYKLSSLIRTGNNLVFIIVVIQTY